MTNINAQEWIDTNLTNKEITEIKLTSLPEEEIWEKEVIAIGGILTGDLVIKDFEELEELDLSDHELTSLTIVNCPELRKIKVRNNQITQLDFSQTKINEENKSVNNKIKEIIAGENEFKILDLTNSPYLENLIIPDNYNLINLEGLSFKSIKNLNLTNSPNVSLVESNEDLKEENKNLWKVLGKINQTIQERKLILTEIVRTAKQAEEAIERLLKETAQEWREYFESEDPNIAEKKSLLGASFKDEEIKRKGKEILGYINEARVDKDYLNLVKKWNGKGKYDATYDFDGSLFDLIQYLKVIEEQKEKIETNEYNTTCHYESRN